MCVLSHNVCLETTMLSFFFFFSPVFSHHVVVAGMTDDLPSPHRPVHLLARSQPSSFRVPSVHACFNLVFIRPFTWYIRPQHFPQYVFIAPHHMPVTDQSSLRVIIQAIISSIQLIGA